MHGNDIRTMEMRELILKEASADALTQQGIKEGMVSLRGAAVDAVAAGDTSIAEALKIIVSE